MSKQISKEETQDLLYESLMDQSKSVFNAKAQDKRIQNARKSASRYAGKTHPIFGKHVGSVPLNEYYSMVQKYGVGFKGDEEFMKYLNNKVLMPNGMAATKL